MTALMTIPALLAPVMLVVAVVRLELGIALLFLACTALFTGGWLLGLRAQKRVQGRQTAAPEGPAQAALRCYRRSGALVVQEHPAEIPVTRENFPDSSRPFPGE